MGYRLCQKIIMCTSGGYQNGTELFAEPTTLPLPEFELVVPGNCLIATVSELSWFLEF